MAYEPLNLPDNAIPEGADITHIEGGITELSTSLAESVIGAGQLKRYVFNTTDTITDQIESLTSQSWTFGYIASSGNGTALGLPMNGSNFVLLIYKHNASYANVVAFSLGNMTTIYFRGLNNGTWSSWYSISTSAISTTSIDPENSID